MLHVVPDTCVPHG